MTADPIVDEHQDELTGSYTFEQLSDCAKDKARDAARDFQVEGFDWWDSVYEDAIRIGALMGIDIGTRDARTMNDRTIQVPSIWFSGFWSQGDGASFEGRYYPRSDAVTAMEAERPEDKTLHTIAEELTTLQVRCQLTWNTTVQCVVLTNRSNYSHSGCMDVSDVYWTDDTATGEDSDNQGLGDELMHLMRRFADWIYTQLEQEHTYLTSNEVVDEHLSDGMLFDGDGDVIR